MVGTRWAARVNSIPLLWGILAGHVFWPWPRESAPWFAGWWVWVVVLSAVIALDLWRSGDSPEKRPWWRRPGLWLLAGVALGHFTWAQRG
jgi:hypothetical protein